MNPTPTPKPEVPTPDFAAIKARAHKAALYMPTETAWSDSKARNLPYFATDAEAEHWAAVADEMRAHASRLEQTVADIPALLAHIAALSADLAAAAKENAELKEKLDWQNMPNRNPSHRGGYEFYINEEWTGLRGAAMDAEYGWHVALRKRRIDPDDERVRVRRVLDDDAILSDLAAAKAEGAVGFLRGLLHSMNDFTWNPVAIVGREEVTGNEQENEHFGHEFVDQGGPGILGDDYCGHAYYPIGNNLYLKVWYQS